MDVPDAYQAYDGSPSSNYPPKRRWARITQRVMGGAMYLAMALVVAIPIGFLRTEVRWQWKWHAAGAVAVLIAAVVGMVLWRLTSKCRHPIAAP